ncbi:hypothetical protein C4D60_Mb04t37120 [Musa balbisiana]|uniref:Uncharacterized protein n=1 Tax=Musa balbisiana TaxID=52838 RepID=A0A4S8KHZ2_MUSBA|nr:hypothetical protein C4D60_Mb04t37120 [Musa balbisiana]
MRWKAHGKPPKSGIAWFARRSVPLAVTSSPDFLSARCQHRRKGFKVAITHFRGEIGDPAQTN